MTQRSPWMGSAQRSRIEWPWCTEGVSYLLEGDLDRADPVLARAFDAAIQAGALPFAPVVLAERCIVAAGCGDWPVAVALAEQALSMVQGGEFDAYWTSALVYAWAARAAIHRGDPTSACCQARPTRCEPRWS